MIVKGGDLLTAAADGDHGAWNALVDQFMGMLWAIARAHRLPTADAADAVQTTWLRLAEHIDRIREPDRVGAWLATTMRRQCLRCLRRSGRELPASDAVVLDLAVPATAGPESEVLRSERDTLLCAAVESLPERCRRLLRLLMADPPPSYEQVSAALDMPVGSIGPTRARCLERLRQSQLLEGIWSQGERSV